MALLKKYLFSQTTIVAVLLVLCVCAVGVRVSELIQPLSSEPHAATGPGSEPAVLESEEVMAPQDVAALNLFGDVQLTTTAVPAAELANVPKTTLDLTLNAVFADTAGGRASAVIALQNNTRSKRYFIGETLPGNALLYKIYPDHVILKRDEQLEKLVFPRDRPE